jgi:hypothetical protein
MKRYCCWREAGMVLSLVRSKSTGLVRVSVLSSSRLAVMVALKSSVWRDGGMARRMHARSLQDRKKESREMVRL